MMPSSLEQKDFVYLIVKKQWPFVDLAHGNDVPPLFFFLF